MLLFAHRLSSCWCLQTNLTLQNILIFLTPIPRNSAVGMQVCPGVQRKKGADTVRAMTQRSTVHSLTRRPTL